MQFESGPNSRSRNDVWLSNSVQRQLEPSPSSKNALDIRARSCSSGRRAGETLALYLKYGLERRNGLGERTTKHSKLFPVPENHHRFSVYTIPVIRDARCVCVFKTLLVGRSLKRCRTLEPLWFSTQCLTGFIIEVYFIHTYRLESVWHQILR